MTNEISNSENKRKRRAWPEKRRQKQAETIRKTKPWTNATGPKTAAGKAAVAHNAYKHGTRSADFIRLRKLLYQQRLFIKEKLCEINAIQAIGKQSFGFVL